MKHSAEICRKKYWEWTARIDVLECAIKLLERKIIAARNNQSKWREKCIIRDDSTVMDHKQ